MDLSVRASVPELMDADDFPLRDYNKCLQDLAAVNRLTLTHRATLRFLDDAARLVPAGTALSILDLAYGHGDLLRAIAGWAERRGVIVNLEGVDLNPRSAVAAMAATPAKTQINYQTGNVFNYKPAQRPDFIVTSQFTHHLSDPDIIRLLSWMDATAIRGWFVADLHRHFVPYYGFRVLARLFGWHQVVRHDGTISIARSFTRHDWQRYLEQAGIKATIRWRLMFRYCIARLK